MGKYDEAVKKLFMKNKLSDDQEKDAGRDNLPFKCPVCGLTYKSLRYLTQHVFQLAYWRQYKRTGKGIGKRIRHYDWLRERKITIKYDVIRRYLESLWTQGLIEEI